MLNLIRAEWTKLRSVRRWSLALLGSVALTLLFSMLAASGSGTDINKYPDLFVLGPNGRAVVDDFTFVHQPFQGDGSFVTRVVRQSESHEWAGAGVMLKDGARPGASYASIMVTPKHGVRLQSNFTTDIAGGGGRWLKLTRSGATVIGLESDDGSTWREVGRVTLAGLPSTVEIGLFVSSPPKVEIQRTATSTSVGERPTRGQATFDNTTLAEGWRGDVLMREEKGAKVLPEAEVSEQNGVYDILGSGRIGTFEPDDDTVQIGLFGVIAGLMTLIAIGVLFVTSEYRRGMMRTTLIAEPRRGRVLAAKAIVLGASCFMLGAIACVVAFLVTQPVLRSKGFGPPGFVTQSLLDGPVLRAVFTSAGFMAAAALLGLGIGVLVRRSAIAITATVLLILLPMITSTMLSPEASRWLLRLTPAGGLATQRAKPPTEGLVEPWAMLSPWTGLGVGLAYAAGALLIAWFALRRRDA